MRRMKIVGLAGIDKGIKSLVGIGQNLNERVQDIAVAIVEHAAGAGNGDVSRALTLVKTVSRMRTLNAAFLVGWFRYFGNCTVNLRANDGVGKVSLIARDAKAYRGGFDVEGARVNNWFDAFDAEGNRSKWYAGPEAPEFQPYGIGDIAERMTRFVKTTNTLLDSTKTVNGKELPAVALTKEEREQVNNALLFLQRISNTLARHDDVEKLKAQLAEVEQQAAADPEVIAVIEPKEKMVA